MQHDENSLRHGCSPVTLLNILRTTFPRNTSGWLLLNCENKEQFCFSDLMILLPFKKQLTSGLWNIDNLFRGITLETKFIFFSNHSSTEAFLPIYSIAWTVTIISLCITSRVSRTSRPLVVWPNGFLSSENTLVRTSSWFSKYLAYEGPGP